MLIHDDYNLHFIATSLSSIQHAKQFFFSSEDLFISILLYSFTIYNFTDQCFDFILSTCSFGKEIMRLYITSFLFAVLPYCIHSTNKLQAYQHVKSSVLVLFSFVVEGKAQLENPKEYFRLIATISSVLVSNCPTFLSLLRYIIL